jgi:hypothetical protein
MGALKLPSANMRAMCWKWPRIWPRLAVSFTSLARTSIRRASAVRTKAESVELRALVVVLTRFQFLECETLRADEATRYLPSSSFTGSRSSEKVEAPEEPPTSLIRARK